MRIAFVSTMSGFPWGGSEELWSAAARAALAANHAVVMSTRAWPQQPRAVEDLVSRGASWWPWPTPLPPPPIVAPDAVSQRPASRGWLPRLGHTPPVEPQPVVAPRPQNFESLFTPAPDVICVSQGGTFDFLDHDDLHELVYRSTRPYVVLSRFNTDDFPITDSDRPKAIEFLTRAYHVGFAAERNLRAAERQLAVRLPHASVMQSPLNLQDAEVLPWPSSSEPAFACVARLDARCKGHDLLFEVLSAPAWTERPWTLSLYGEGPDRSRYEELLRFFGLTERVQFAGHVSDISGIWRANHLLALPSRAEGTPQSLIQAMLYGRPAVATDVGGVSDWLTDGKSGFVAEAPTVSSLARALERAWTARADWAEMGRTAHDAALARVDRDPAETLLRMLSAAAKPDAFPRP